MRLTRGFSLIEVLVALAILGLSLGILFSIFNEGLGAARNSKDHVHAAVLADSRISEALGRPRLEPGEWSGVDDAGYTWSVSVRPTESMFPENEYRPEIVLLSVEALVSWQDGRRTRTLSLSTLRIGETP